MKYCSWMGHKAAASSSKGNCFYSCRKHSNQSTHKPWEQLLFKIRVNTFGRLRAGKTSCIILKIGNVFLLNLNKDENQAGAGAEEHSSVRTEHLLLHRTRFSGELLSSASWAWEKMVMATPATKELLGLSSQNPRASQASLPHLQPCPQLSNVRWIWVALLFPQ